jgi:hypothetical protein
MVDLLPAAVWLHHINGERANRCVEAVLTLVATYTQLGIPARPHTVELTVSGPTSDRRVVYGEREPYWDNGGFHGHAVIWLPRSRRFIDPTVEQYPEVRDLRLGPISGRATMDEAAPPGNVAAEEDLPAGSRLGVHRGPLTLIYTVVGSQGAALGDAPAAVEDQDRYRRAGQSLACDVLQLLRAPEIIDRVPATRYPHLARILRLVAGAELVHAAGETVFEIADPAGRRRLSMPDLSGQPSE